MLDSALAIRAKEATLNPMNPRDRAADWEVDIIQRFRNDPKAGEMVGERDTPMGKSLYLARLIRNETECAPCHSAPSAAPRTLIARHGAGNGFGWQSNEIVGAQVVSVPFARATANARESPADARTITHGARSVHQLLAAGSRMCDRRPRAWSFS